MKLRELFKDITAGNDSDRVVGIDIGSSSIKVVEVQEKNDLLTLTSYGELQLGPYDDKEIGQSVILNPKKEQQALVDVIRESAVKASDAVLALPLSASFVTMIDFVASENEDLSSRVRVEARKYIPVPISEVTLDWAEVESDVRKGKDVRSVLVAAIQNESLNRFRILTQFANLKQPPTEIECFSAIRGIFKEDETDVAVIDIGAVSTKLYIAHDGLLQRMHRVRAGGALATKKIATKLGLSFEEAEERKRLTAQGDPDFSEIEIAHNESYDRTWREIRQVIQEYEDRRSAEIEKVYLTGGGAIFPTIKNTIADALRKEVVMVNTFNKVAYPAFMEDMVAELGPTFHIALGAALRVFE